MAAPGPPRQTADQPCRHARSYSHRSFQTVRRVASRSSARLARAPCACSARAVADRRGGMPMPCRVQHQGGTRCCGSSRIQEQPKKSSPGYRTFRCRRRCNDERTGIPFNDLSVPTDIVFLVVAWRLRYTSSLRDLAELFLERGFAFSHETVRAREALVAVPVGPAGAVLHRTHRTVHRHPSWPGKSGGLGANWPHSRNGRVTPRAVDPSHCARCTRPQQDPTEPRAVGRDWSRVAVDAQHRVPPGCCTRRGLAAPSHPLYRATHTSVAPRLATLRRVLTHPARGAVGPRGRVG